MKAPFCVLAIAGSDSGGGAGIQSDQRTVRAIGGHALTAVTAVTAQDTRGVSAWEAVSTPLIAAQVASALRGFPVAAVKTGTKPTVPLGMSGTENCQRLRLSPHCATLSRAVTPEHPLPV